MRFTKTKEGRIPLDAGNVVELADKGGRAYGEYVIDRLVGEGGFSLIYIAHEINAERERYVALKELFPKRLVGMEAVRRSDKRIVLKDSFGGEVLPEECEQWQNYFSFFVRERDMAKKASVLYSREGRMLHQNNPDVLDTRGPFVSAEGNVYLVIDTYNGESLGDIIESGWQDSKNKGEAPNCALSDVFDVLKKVSTELSALHEDKRLFHLDLSPGNVYVTKRTGGTELDPYIIDFGSAVERDRLEGKTLKGYLFTCNTFSAPELIALSELQRLDAGYSVDASCDTYSLATMLYYGMLGEYYRGGISFDANWEKKLRDIYPSEVFREFTEKAVSFFKKALSADRRGRYLTATELYLAIKELDEAYSGKGLLAKIQSDEKMAYMLLDRYPLYEYSTGDTMNVLCLGSGAFVNRMVLTMLGTGQMITKKLCIHIVSVDTEDYKERLIAAAPELKKYSNLTDEHKEIYVSFVFETVSELRHASVCEEIAEKYGHCKYVIVSLGSNALNKSVANAFGECFERRSVEKAVIHYCLDDDAAANERGVIGRRLSAGVRLSHFSAREYTFDETELGYRAFRVHYLYKKRYNPFVSESDALREFIDEEYLQKSSLASALHVKYKLADVMGVKELSLCGRGDIITAYIACLSLKRDELMALEHRRWLMYMITDGYTLPDIETVEEYSFAVDENGIFNRGFRCVPKKFHNCLVTSGGHKDSLSGKSFAFWDSFTSYGEVDRTDFDDLDKMSLKMHLLASKKMQSEELADDIRYHLRKLVKATPKGDKGLKMQVAAFTEKAEKLILHKIAHESVFGSLDALRIAFKARGVDASKLIGGIEDRISVFGVFSRYLDYKKADAIIVDNLLWLYFGGEKVSLLKVVSPLGIDNVVPPLLLEVDRVCYLGDESQTASCVRFFENRKIALKVECERCDSADGADVLCAAERLAGTLKGNVVVDVTGVSPRVADTLVRGAVNGAYSVIRCDPLKQRVINLQGFDIAPVYRIKNAVSVAEFQMLSGIPCEKTDGDSIALTLNKYVDLLWGFYSAHRAEWKAVSDLFYRDAKESPELFVKRFRPDWAEGEKQFFCRVEPHLYRSIRFGEFLAALQDKDIIRNLRESVSDRHVEITLSCPLSKDGEALFDALAAFSESNVGNVAMRDETHKISENEYSIIFTSGLRFELADADNIGYPPHRLSVLLEAAEKAEIINSYPALNPRTVFDFNDFALKECFSSPNNVLKAYIWRKVRETGLFDDVYAAPCISAATEGGDADNVLFTWGFSSFLVRCVSERLRAEHLYKARSAASTLSPNTVAIIAVADEKEQVDDDVRKAAKEAGVWILSAQSFDKDSLLRRIATEK